MYHVQFKFWYTLRTHTCNNALHVVMVTVQVVSGLTLTLLITMIIQHYRRTINMFTMHCRWMLQVKCFLHFCL